MRGALTSAAALLVILLFVGSPTFVAGQGDVAIDVILRDTLRFDPSRIVVPPGSEVTLRLMNIGVIDHTFTLFAQKDAQVPVSSDSQIQSYNASNAKIVDVLVHPGAEETVTFTAPTEEGTYTFVCMISLHSQGGMHGVMIVGTEAGPDLVTIGIIVGVVVVIGVAATFLFLRRRGE